MSHLFTVKPLASRILNPNRGLDWADSRQRLFDAADEVVELAPPSIEPSFEAISLPGELDRATGAIGDLARQHKVLTPGEIRFGPTLSYRYSQALLADETIYVRGLHYVCGSGRKRPVIFDRHDSFDEAQLCNHPATRIFFGHWVRDAMCLELLARERGMVPLSFKSKAWLHEPAYRRIFELPETSTSLARVERLWITDDRELNGSWGKRFRELRSRVRSVAGKDGPSHVFLSRGSAGSARDIQNRREIEALLAGRGFTVIEPEFMAADEIIRALRSARILVSGEGSNLIHAQLALPESSAMVVIQPPTQFNAHHKSVADIVGLRFGFVVGEAAGRGFTVDPSRLMRTIDLAENVIGKS